MDCKIKRTTDVKESNGTPKRKTRKVTKVKNNIKNPSDELIERALKLLRNDLY